MSNTSASMESNQLTAFSDLNDFVNQLFFDGRHESSPVYLDLEDKEAAILAEHTGVEPSELDEWIGSVVLETLDFSNRNNMQMMQPGAGGGYSNNYGGGNMLFKPSSCYSNHPNNR